jgi:phage shock protein E
MRAVILCLLLSSVAACAAEIPNRLIDYPAFERNVEKVGRLRAQRRVTEDEFIRMAADPATVILDARSAERFRLLHVRGAKNLSLPDITAEELARVIPSKSTRVLIYCNNNFLNEPKAFATKIPSASLNIHTIIVLYSYGYTNVYELGSLIDMRKAKLEFEGGGDQLAQLTVPAS